MSIEYNVSINELVELLKEGGEIHQLRGVTKVLSISYCLTH